MSRSDWFWSEEGKRDRAAVRDVCRRAAPLTAGMLGEEMAWLMYQQRVRITTELERRFAAVMHEVSHGS
jgi:hypothetical protein